MSGGGVLCFCLCFKGTQSLSRHETRVLQDLEACCRDIAAAETSSSWLQVLFRLRQQWLSKMRETKRTADKNHTALLSSPASSSYSNRSHALVVSSLLCSSDRLPSCLYSLYPKFLSGSAFSLLDHEKKKKLWNKQTPKSTNQNCAAICKKKKRKKKPFVEPQWEGFDVKLSRGANRPTRKNRDILFLWCVF